MQGQIDHVRIRGVAAALPGRRIDNMEFAPLFGEKEVKKQIKVTGMRYRYVLDESGQTAIDLCVDAAERVMEQCRCAPGEIDYIIYATHCREYRIPSMAYEAMNRLKVGAGCTGFDICLGCTAYISGLHTLAALVSCGGKGTRGLLLAGDSPSEYVESDDKVSGMLLTDCGSAVLLEWDDTAEPMSFVNYSDGARYETIIKEREGMPLYMDGMSVFEFTISDVVDTIKEFMDKEAEKTVDYTVLHQAQKFIVDKVVAFAGLSKETNLTAYEEYANGGGASIPLTVCKNVDRIQRKRINPVSMLWAGFGSGLAWECMRVSLCPENILPVHIL